MPKRKLYECKGADVESCLKWLKHAQKSKWLRCDEFEQLDKKYGGNKIRSPLAAEPHEKAVAKTRRFMEQISSKIISSSKTSRKSFGKIQEQFCTDVQKLCVDKMLHKKSRVEAMTNKCQKRQQEMQRAYHILCQYVNNNYLKIYIPENKWWCTIRLVTDAMLTSNFQYAIHQKPSTFSLNMLKESLTFVLQSPTSTLLFVIGARFISADYFYWIHVGQWNTISLDQIEEAHWMQSIYNNPSPWIAHLVEHFDHITDLAKLALQFLTPPP